ncbi:MAG: hypothetical protein JXK07_04175 [Spirochaetes bacterium]|nr:hypothetical protein [Spirochaetota bacterium]
MAKKVIKDNVLDFFTEVVMDIEKKYNELKRILENMESVDDSSIIMKIADRLHGISYSPPFLIEVKHFTEMDKKSAITALKYIFEFPESEIKKFAISRDKPVAEIKIDAMNSFVTEYGLLQRLRMDVPEAWDQINELYEDD